MTGTVAVVLNYRTAGDTIEAVRALQRSTPPVPAIIVVDNGSADDSTERFRTGLNGVDVIAASENGGFSAGCNLGIRAALARGAARVLLLNSDVTVSAGALGALEEALDRDPRLGIAGPIVLSREDPGRIQSLGISYDERTGRMRQAGVGELVSTMPPFTRVTVDGVSGCAMLIRRPVFDAIGLLAEEFFFGFEDLDFCLRARAAGFASGCIGGATVLHEGSVSIGRGSRLRSYFATRNHLMLASRVSAGCSRAARSMRATWIVALNLVHVLLTSDVPRWEGLRGLTCGLRDHLAGRYGRGPDWTM